MMVAYWLSCFFGAAVREEKAHVVIFWHWQCKARFTYKVITLLTYLHTESRLNPELHACLTLFLHETQQWDMTYSMSVTRQNHPSLICHSFLSLLFLCSSFFPQSHSPFTSHSNLWQSCIFHMAAVMTCALPLPSPIPSFFPSLWQLPVMFSQHPCISTAFPLRCCGDLYHWASKHERGRKKNCQGSKGRILKWANPQSVCWCVFCSTLNPPPPTPCGFSPLWRLGKANRVFYRCQPA